MRKVNTIRIMLVGSLLVLLSACASSGSNSTIPDADNESVDGAKINVKLATGYMEKGEYEIALEKLQRALQFDPDYATAHTVLGVLYGRINKPDLAGKHFKRAAELNPNDGGVLNNYGQYLCQIKQYQKAYPYFAKAIDQPFYRTPQSALANAGRCAIDEGKLDKAEEYLRAALKTAPSYPPTLYELAELMRLKGNYLKARAFLQRYHASGQVSANSLILGYYVEMELGDKKASNEYRQQLIQKFPNSELTDSIL